MQTELPTLHLGCLYRSHVCQSCARVTISPRCTRRSSVMAVWRNTTGTRAARTASVRLSHMWPWLVPDAVRLHAHLHGMLAVQL